MKPPTNAPATPALNAKLAFKAAQRTPGFARGSQSAPTNIAAAGTAAAINPIRAPRFQWLGGTRVVSAT
jgi:hypothetical protein